MATVVSPDINATNPFCRLSICCDVRDFWDATNFRYKSGYNTVTISDISIAAAAGGSEVAGERISVEVKPPNLSQVANSRQLYDQEVDDDAWFGADYILKTAFNYGRPGPSARLEGDNSVSLVDVDIQLQSNALSAVVVTVTYTLSTSLKDPYGDLGGTSKSRILRVYPDNEAAWGLIGVDAQDAAAIGIQLQTLATTVQQGVPLGVSPPMLSIQNVPQYGGQQLCDLAFPLGESATRSKTFSDMYTWIWAVNGSRVDCNGTNIELPNDGKTLFNLLNVGLTKNAGLSRDAASALLTYKVNAY